LLRSEGIKETLQSICQSQNLTYPKNFSPPNSRGSPKRKRDTNDDDDVERKKQETKKKLSPQRKFRSRVSSDKVLAAPSVLELLPESNNGLNCDSINSNVCLQSDSDESHSNRDEINDDNSIKGSNDDDSFGVIGDWAP
jgi:hypothetical protein